MRTSPRGIQFIKDKEGLRLVAYRDAVGVLTIGWGHTSDHRYPVTPGMRITRQQAEAMLMWDISEAEGAINRLVHVPLNGNEYGSLVSFVLNVGIEAFARSSLLRALNAGKKDLHREFGMWVKGGSPLQTIPGLVRRRSEESALFSTPIELGHVVVDTNAPTIVVPETVEARGMKGIVETGYTGDTAIKLGTGSTGTGAVTDIIRDQTDQLSFIAYYSTTIQYIVVALVLIGVGLTFFGLWQKYKGRE